LRTSIDAQPPDSFDELVSRTEGLQPLRKLFHAFNGIVVAAGLTFLGLAKQEALIILGGIGVLLVLGDGLRLYYRPANELFFRAFSSWVSPREARRPASSTWYVFGIVMTLIVVPMPVAVSGVLVLGLADPIASVIGQKFGRRPFLGGTVEGTTVFVLVALTILLVRHPWQAAVPAAILAAFAERRSWPLDDNFTVPLVTGLAIYSVTLLLL
jgi:dolichol kinase